MDGTRKPLPDDPVEIPLEDYQPEPKPRVCRMCFARRLDPRGPCPSCGFDERAGLTAATRIGKCVIGEAGLKCAKCGYDLQGLRSPRCPECGTVAAAHTRRAYDRQESKRIARQAYLTPTLMFAIGMALLIPTWYAQGGAEGVAARLLIFGLELPIGVGVFLLCCLIWIGFDAPIHLTALRLAAIYAVVDLIRAFTGFIPLAGWIIPILVYIALLAHFLEMAFTDAILVGLITWFTKVLLVFALIAAFGLY